MSDQTIDYDALAKKFGATSYAPDYDALAKQHGATSSTVPGMEQLGGTPPPVPKPPIPTALTPEQPGKTRVMNMVTGEAKDFPSPKSALGINPASDLVEGAKNVVAGTQRMAAPGARNKV